MDVGNTTAAATAPTGANTVLLLDTFVLLKGTPLDTYLIERYVFLATNDQAGTIRLLKSDDGTTWDTFVSQAVAAPVGPLTVSGPVDFAVGGVRHLQVKWVNGGVTQGVWRLNQKLIEADRAAQS